MPGSAFLSRLAGWLAIVAMAANLCVGMAAAGRVVGSPAAAPACCCGEGCECGPGCACSVAPADPAEHRPDTPAPNAKAPKSVPLEMSAERRVGVAMSAPSGDPRPVRASARGCASGQRETRLRTGICTT